MTIVVIVRNSGKVIVMVSDVDVFAHLGGSSILTRPIMMITKLMIMKVRLSVSVFLLIVVGFFLSLFFFTMLAALVVSVAVFFFCVYMIELVLLLEGHAQEDAETEGHQVVEDSEDVLALPEHA